MNFQYNDGGRSEAGYKGETRDCSTRAIAIATGLPYQKVYDSLTAIAKSKSRPGSHKHGSARTGVSMDVIKLFMDAIGWEWVPTMQIGQGCRVHLRADELPSGHIIVRLSKHLCAVIDGVINDTYNPDRDGTRCVYGYWRACSSVSR